MLDNNKNDSLTPDVRRKFEEKLATVIQAKLFDINETRYVESFLNTKEDILAFSMTMVKIKFPEFKHPESLDIAIGEDETKKLWFVLVKPPYVGHGGALFIIVAKNNCQIVYYERTK